MPRGWLTCAIRGRCWPIRINGKGDVTKSAVAWQANEGLPDITSPVTNGKLLFLLTTQGTVTCYDAKTGKKLWDHSYEAEFRASPVIAGKCVLLMDCEGNMHAIDAGGLPRGKADGTRREGECHCRDCRGTNVHSGSQTSILYGTQRRKVVEETGFIDSLVARVGRGKQAVIPILQAIQAEYRYLPEEALRRVCEITDITPAAITGIASFYSQFRHRPAGRHLISVCHGTACHVKGADLVYDAVRRDLGHSGEEDTDSAGRIHCPAGFLPGMLHAGPGGADRRGHLRPPDSGFGPQGAEGFSGTRAAGRGRREFDLLDGACRAWRRSGSEWVRAASRVEARRCEQRSSSR